jgi:GT2 family glycosyltransferase
MTARVLEIELTQGLRDRADMGDYGHAFVLLRYHGRPVGTVRVPCREGTLCAADVWEAAAANIDLSLRLSQTVLSQWLAKVKSSSISLLTWSIVICTRNRTDDLRRCLDALMRLRANGGEIIVVDNAPSDDRTAQLVARYPARYVREDRVGLNWARSRGARMATGEIVIFTDDDVVVDPDWIPAILEPFSHPRVAAVTGLTMPLELESEAQELFEIYGGFGRGFRRRTFDYTVIAPAASGAVGAGSNMAFRRELLNRMRLFDAELDGGTVTRSGGDAYAFYRLLAGGYQIVYTPDALVWHRHRRDYASLRRTLAGYSVGGFAVLTRCWVEHGDWQALAIAVGWLRYDHLRQLMRAVLRRPRRLPLDLVLAQIFSVPLGPWAYFVSRSRERVMMSRARLGAESTGAEP